MHLYRAGTVMGFVPRPVNLPLCYAWVGRGGGGGANGYLYAVYAVILQIRYPPHTLQITGQIVIHTCFELSNAAFLQVQMVLYL